MGIGQQNSQYFGDATRQPEVAGRIEHWDFWGVGTDSQTYSYEFNQALTQAFNKAPQGTLRLKALKSFKSNDPFVPALGGAMISLGISQYQASLPLSLTLLGLGLVTMGVHHYDLVLIGEPTAEE